MADPQDWTDILREMREVTIPAYCGDDIERAEFSHIADRLEATIRAHIEGLEAEKAAQFIRAREWAERCGQQEARAEAAEARVRELEAHVADRESEIDVLKAERARAEARTDYTGLRGFGFNYYAETGRVRNWYIDPSGVKRWADDDSRVEEAHGND